MPLVRVPIDLQWSGPGSPGQNIWDVRLADDPGPGGSTELNAAVAALHAFYSDLTDAPTVFARGYSASFAGLATDLVSKQLYTAPQWSESPLGSPSDAPPVAQAVITLRTSQATKNGRGRKFIGPCNANAVQDDGTLVDAIRGNMQTSLNTLISASTGANGWAISIVSFYLNKVKRPTPVGLDVTAGVVRDYFASLRSRRD